MATNRISFPSGAYPGESFAYDVANPTQYTEHLSFYVLQCLDAIANNGGTIEIELETNETLTTSYETWHAEFRTWLDGAQESVANYLTAPEGERLAFLVPFAPTVPTLLGGAIMLSKGLAVKMALDVVFDVVRSVQKFQAETRLVRQERMLDKALFDDGWFSSPVPKLDRLIETLKQSGLARDAIGSDKPFVEELIDALGGKEGIIKVLSHVVVNSHGNIEGVDFGLAEDFGV